MKTRYIVCFLLALLLFAAPALSEAYDSSTMTDFVFASPGDAGYDVQRVLAAAKGTGFLKELSTSEETYRDKYIDAVKKMEETYGFTVDGIIMYTEWVQLSEMKYPGMQGKQIKGMLEKLSDLGFITTTLPDTHDKYQQTYVSAVKQAEKQYKLKEDGILTKDEWKTINNKKVTQPAAPTNVKASLSGTTATITWSSVKGAKHYEIYGNGELLGTSKGTSFTAKNLELGYIYGFSVIACKYTVKSNESTDFSTVDVLRSPNAKELNDNYDKWAWQIVRMNDAYCVSKSWDGSDLYYLVKKSYNGKTYYFYYLLEDARNWDWNGTPIYNCKVTTIDMKGTCIAERKYSSYGNVPVIDVYSVTFSY